MIRSAKDKFVLIGFKKAEWTKRMKKGCVLSGKFPFSNHEQAPQSFRSLRRLFLRFFFRLCDGGHQAAEEDGCGNAGGTGGDAAREHAENAFFFYGGFYTLA